MVAEGVEACVSRTEAEVLSQLWISQEQDTGKQDQ